MTHRACSTLVALFAVASLASTITAKPQPHYIWNLTPSVPLGLYSVQPPVHLRVTTLVVATPPEPLATVLSDGGYLPRGVVRRFCETLVDRYSTISRVARWPWRAAELARSARIA